MLHAGARKEMQKKAGANWITMVKSVFLKEIKTLANRLQQGIENPRIILLRGVFWPNKWRYHRLKVMKEDWKYLIILDACRFDIFREENIISGILRKKYSAGTSTTDWMRENFKGSYPDVVYVSANPNLSDYMFKKWLDRSNPFFRLERVWAWGWDDELGTVHPRTVNQAVLKLLEQYGDKRMIIHYMQPHYPYISEVMNRNMKEYKNGIEFMKLSSSRAREAYIENLRIVLKHVKELLNNLPPSKIVVSSDHGEYFGEYGVFFHLPYFYIRPLLEIPWLEIKN